MASSVKNLSEYRRSHADMSGKKFALAVSSYHIMITEALYQGAVETILKEGGRTENIHRFDVPGAYELPQAAQWLAARPEIDAVICIGCVIQGQTRHFDFICQSVADGVMRVALESGKPVIFGVLTPENMEQAMDRAGGQHGNKGVEAAAAAIQMLALKDSVGG